MLPEIARVLSLEIKDFVKVVDPDPDPALAPVAERAAGSGSSLEVGMADHSKIEWTMRPGIRSPDARSFRLGANIATPCGWRPGGE